MKSGTRLPDWLHELGKLANGLAGVPSSTTRKDKFKRFLLSVVVCGVLYSCSHKVDFSGKNFAEDTADFGKDSLASRRYLGTVREDCFQISICLLWPHAFCTQDLKHALSTAYLVKRAAPQPWCICVDSRDFSLTEVTRILDLLGRELHGHRFVSSSSPSPLRRQIASPQEDGMPKFPASCSDVVALARAKLSSPCVELGCSSALCRVRHERPSVA